ncbi:MAG: SDR family NAD(P)-dependent oxidoreductase [Actinomycetes bacterium]
MRVALVTGGSKGLGLALARELAGRGWTLVLDARGGKDLARAATQLRTITDVLTVSGDVADPAHRRELAGVVAELGRLDLLVNNASVLGPSPLPGLAYLPLPELERVLAVNVLAPLALVQLLLPALERDRGRLVNISSDAAVEAYPGWGGYGASKAALDQLTNVLGAEHPTLRCYAVDPGDMRTDLHQAAYPGEDISDRPEPATVVPALMRLVEGDLPSGRYRAAELAAVELVGR